MWFLYACAGADAPKADTTAETGAPDTADTADTATTGGPVTLPADCVAPTTGVAPLLQTGRLPITQTEPSPDPFMEALDIEVYGDVAYVVGQGGLTTVDVSDPTAPTLAQIQGGRWQRIERVTGDQFVTTWRDLGVDLQDVSDITAPNTVASDRDLGFEGVAVVGDRIYGAAADRIQVWNADLSRLAAVTGSPAPIDLTGADGWMYASDATVGLVPYDLTAPDAPVMGTAVDVGGSPQDVFLDGDWVYVATGGSGVVVLDRSDPAAPVVVARMETGGSTRSVHVADGLAWIADYESLSVWDVSDPTTPAPIAWVEVEQFAMTVYASGTRAWLGDWGIFEIYDLDPDAVAGALDSPGDEVWLTEGEGTLTLTNRGGGTLTLTGATLDGPGTVTVDAATLPPGASTTLRVHGATENATICLAADDPVTPVRSLAVVATPDAPVGTAAPDFTLTDIDGVTWRLSELRGHVVMLAYFATW